MIDDLWSITRKEEQLARLRKKWSQAKKAHDEILMGIIERQARIIIEHTS